MTDELIEVLNEKGEYTGRKITREKAHREGIWHSSVHVWLLYQKGCILQKRAFSKDSLPGYYDTSASGHVIFGETPTQAAVRETTEELNIRLKEEDLIFVDVRKLVIKNYKTSFISNEFNYIFAANIEYNFDDIVYQTEEIDSIRYIKLDTLQKELVTSNSKFCFDASELKLVMEKLLER